MKIAAFIIGLSVICSLNSPSSGLGAQYFLLNYAPDGLFSSKPIASSAIMNYVSATFGKGNRASPLKVGVSCLYCPGAAKGGSLAELALMREDLALAERLKVPILVQVDVENWLPASLLNWFNPGAAGYDPSRRADVERYGWDKSTAIKLSWRNWGREIRVGPAPNYLCADYEAYERHVYEQFLPVVVRWYQHLPSDEKWLFVGWRCGWESSLNGNYRFFPNGNSHYGKASNPAWSAQYAQLGYNAAQTAGIQTNGIITQDTIAKIVGRHLAFLAEMASRARIPKNKIFDHGTFYTNCQQNVDARESVRESGCFLLSRQSEAFKFLPCIHTCRSNRSKEFWSNRLLLRRIQSIYDKLRHVVSVADELAPERFKLRLPGPLQLRQPVRQAVGGTGIAGCPGDRRARFNRQFLSLPE